MKLYIDGCSFTYGAGLPRNKTLGHLFSGYYEVIDNSRPGKSNQAIVYDTWNNLNCDVYVLGFTFSERNYLKFRGADVDLLPSLANPGYSVQKYNNADLELAHQRLHAAYYTFYDSNFYDQQSDMLVDMLLTKLKSQNKMVAPFSFQKRNTPHTLFYPVILEEHRISAVDGHFNEAGTNHLFHCLTRIIMDSKQNV